MNDSQSAPERARPESDASGFWRLPFRFPQAIVVAVTFFMNGWLLDTVSPVRDVVLPPWPVNLYAFTIFLAILAAIAAYAKNSPLVASLAGVPMSVASMGMLCGLSLLVGFIPQGGGDWLHNIKGSWPFAFILFLVLTNLGLTAFRRLFCFKWRDIWFVMVHSGIWIVLAAMACGASDLQRLRIQATEGNPTALAFREGAQGVQSPMTMPFEILLRDFSMQQYPPKLISYNLDSGKGEKLIAEVSEGSRFEDGKILVEVTQFLAAAMRQGDLFVATSTQTPGSIPAAYVRVSDAKTKTLVKEGWVSATQNREAMSVLHLKESIVVLAEPETKLYRSEIEILENGAQKVKATIEVNQPFTYRGWKIYQTSYDAEAGRHSRLSVFELIKDPWLPVVYFGSFLVLLGSLDLMWNGLRRVRKEHEAEELS